MATSSDVEDAIRSVVGENMAQPGFAPDEDVTPPYVNFMPYEYDIMRASDQAWIWQEAYDVVLCTRARNVGLERQLFDALNERGVVIREVVPTANLDEGLYYFEIFTEPVMSDFENESEDTNGS